MQVSNEGNDGAKYKKESILTKVLSLVIITVIIHQKRFPRVNCKSSFEWSSFGTSAVSILKKHCHDTKSVLNQSK